MADLSHLSHVLVLEDEAMILLDIEQTMTDAGVARVSTASTVAEAMQALGGGERFDGAVLDLHLGPSGWSYDVARQLRALEIPFIFTSGTVSLAEGFQSVPLVNKPFSTDQLVAALLDVSADRTAEAAE